MRERVTRCIRYFVADDKRYDVRIHSMAQVRMGQKRTALHAGKRGTILVACSDATMARSCLTYLTAMFEDRRS